MVNDKENFLKKISIKNKQRAITKKFIEEGLTDEVLNLQIELNKEKHLLNLSNDYYVQ